jgi:hypothetical protein
MLTTRAWRLLRGLRSLRRDGIDVEGSIDAVAAQVRDRDARFTHLLDELVWSVPSSPYLPLLTHAGAERGDVVDLVAREGLAGALRQLCDAGVYISYDEWLGRRPARRGSATFELRPADFTNPRTPPDQLGSTSGTRSGGTTVGMSFANLRHGAELEVVRMAAWDGRPGRTAVWLPVLPSGAGLNAILRHATMGQPPEAWFSQVPPGIRQITIDKQAANRLLPLAGRLMGLRLPRPVHTPVDDPDPVVDWCERALAAAGTAAITGYTSSMVVLCRRAVERGVSLDGLTITVTGEPLTAAKAVAMRAAGATPVNRYAFMQFGAAGVSCPLCADEALHVWDGDVAVITRRVERPDGTEVDAFLWTSLDPRTRGVFLNVENDDYGDLDVDQPPCSCLLGQLGMRTRVAHVRGVSKIVADGMTVRGEVFEQLADIDLPSRFGGGPGDWQFAEVELDGRTHVTLRVAPRVGTVDAEAVRAVVREAIRREEVGRLADEIWQDRLRVERMEPQPRPSGKVLPYQALATPLRGDRRGSR